MYTRLKEGVGILPKKKKKLQLLKLFFIFLAIQQLLKSNFIIYSIKYNIIWLDKIINWLNRAGFCSF